MNGEIGPGHVTSDEIRWEEEAIEAQHTALKDVRGVAAGWSASISGLLGIAGTITVVKGPEKLSDLEHSAATAVAVMVLTAVLLAVVAAMCAAIAAQGVPKWLARLDGPALRARNRDAAKQVITLLWWSRGLALAAIVAVFAALGTAWISTAEGEPATKTSVIVVGDDGILRCGVLSKTASGRALLSADGKLPGTPVGAVRDLVQVTACP